MAKEKFYVSVGQGLVLKQPSASVELQVMVDQDELDELRYRLGLLADADDNSYFRAHVPYKSSDHDEVTDETNDAMVNLYKFLYSVGTPETKELIRSMDIIPKLSDPDYVDEGYIDKERWTL